MADHEDRHRRLSDISLGDSVEVCGFRGSTPVRRFVALGLVPGATVTAIRRAPLGDPVEYAVLGGRVSLRRSDAERIEVDELDGAGCR